MQEAKEAEKSEEDGDQEAHLVWGFSAWGLGLRVLNFNLEVWVSVSEFLFCVRLGLQAWGKALRCWGITNPKGPCTQILYSLALK